MNKLALLTAVGVADFLLIGGLAFSGGVAAENKIDCEVEFQNIVNQGDSFDIRGKIHQAEQKLGGSCVNTGVYEGGLARLYSLSGDNEKALKILSGAIDKKIPNDKELRLGYFDALFRLNKLIEAENYANKLISDYPDWYGGYISIGQIKLVNDNYNEAIKYLSKSNKLKELPSANILLVIAYFNIADYRQSALSMQKAIKLDVDSLSHTQAVCATSYSLLELGHKAEAKDLLSKHLVVNPEAKNNPEYKKAVSIVESVK